MGATDRRAPAGFAPLAIGLRLTLIHLMSIPVTNTSVNPARSTGAGSCSRWGATRAALALLARPDRRWRDRRRRPPLHRRRRHGRHGRDQLITPRPPRADVALPWDEPVADVVATLADARRRFGDTFAVDAGGTEHLFCLLPRRRRSFYALPEAEASKGVADWQMLRRKLPPELFDGRRTLPHELFGPRRREQLPGRSSTPPIDDEFAELGDAGHIDVFASPAGWATAWAWPRGPGRRRPRRARFDGLVDALDALDGSDAFVHPGAWPRWPPTARRTSGPPWPRRGTPGETLPSAAPAHPATTSSAASSSAGPTSTAPEADRGIARDVILVHLGSMSNLFAGPGLDDRAAPAAPRRGRPGPERRGRAAGAVRPRVDPPGSALGHAAGRAPAGRGPPTSDTTYRSAPGTARHVPAPDQHHRPPPAWTATTPTGGCAAACGTRPSWPPGSWSPPSATASTPARRCPSPSPP